MKHVVGGIIDLAIIISSSSSTTITLISVCGANKAKQSIILHLLHHLEIESQLLVMQKSLNEVKKAER